MDDQEIRYEVRDRVLTLTLHRPEKLNAFTGHFSRSAHLASPEARVVPWWTEPEFE
jgi:enoyl-CoA hydratase/carnithine racemase